VSRPGAGGGRAEPGAAPDPPARSRGLGTHEPAGRVSVAFGRKPTLEAKISRPATNCYQSSGRVPHIQCPGRRVGDFPGKHQL